MPLAMLTVSGGISTLALLTLTWGRSVLGMLTVSGGHWLQCNVNCKLRDIAFNCVDRKWGILAPVQC